MATRLHVLFVLSLICLSGTCHAQLAGCEATYVDWSTGTDANGKLALFAWTTTTDEAVNYIPNGTCTIGAQWSGVNHNPYYHTYNTSVSIAPSSAPIISVRTTKVQQSGNTNGTNTANASYEDPCFSSDLPGCSGQIIDISGDETTSCSVAGSFYSSGLMGVKFSLALSNFQYQKVSAGICSYPLSCPNGNANATCQTGTFEKAAPCPYTFISSIFLVVRKAGTQQCVGLGRAVESNAPLACF